MAADAGLLAAEMLLAAFAGGAVGAALGPLPSLGLAGLVVAISEATPDLTAPATDPAGTTTGTNLSTQPVAAGADGLTALVGLGPALGPHVAFAGGVAATAYAARKGYLDDDAEYHAAKNVRLGLGSRPDVLVVGGVFGVVGYWLGQLSVLFGLPWDPVAASVVLSAFLHRVVFGYPLLGRIDGGLLDMSPYEDGTRRMAPDGSDDPDALTGRLVVEPWQPAHYEWGNVAVLGLAVGVFGAFVGVLSGSYYLAFGLAVASLLVAAAGAADLPVTHHMALPASIAALALPATPVPVALVVGGVFGLVGGLAGELAQRLFYAHADTHFDPAFASIFLTSVLIAALDIAGVFTQTAIPTVV